MASLLDKVSDAIRTGTVGAETKKSAKWFLMKTKGLEGSLRNRWTQTNAPKFYREAETKVSPKVLKLRVNRGDMFAYYYHPKHRATLPYYDQFPLIMLMSEEKETFIGINFHYLNPNIRAILLDKINSKVGTGQITNSWWTKLSKIPQIAPTVKRYRYDHIVRKVIPIEEKEKELAIFLPLERFKKSSKSKVWADSKKRIGT